MGKPTISVHRLSVNLRILRTQLKWSQRYLAERSGVDLKYINGLESQKKQRPSLLTVDKLAKALRVEPHILLMPRDKMGSLVDEAPTDKVPTKR